MVIIVSGYAFIIRHRLPGRLRLYLPGLKAGSLVPGLLVAALQTIPGVQGARASSLTGSLLLFYRPQDLKERELLHKVQDIMTFQGRLLPEPVQIAPTGTDFLRVIAGGGILAALVLKRLIAGEPPLASSARIVNAAALVTAITGYPILRRSLNALIRGRGVNTDLLLTGAAVSMLLLRESLTGLMILVLTEGLRLTEGIVSRQARAALASLGEGREYALRLASLPPPDAGRVNDHVQRASKLSLGLAGVTYLWYRDARQALALLVAGAPLTASLAETAVATAAMRLAAENGVLVYDGRHLLALPAMDTLVWCQEGIITPGRPVLRGVIECLRSLGLRRHILLNAAGLEAEGLLDSHPEAESRRAGITPEEKAAVIKGLKEQGHLVAAVGSDLEDEPVLAVADFSLALGRPLATADVLSLSPDPARVVDIFNLARRADRLYRQEFLYASAANFMGLGLAFLGVLSPAAAMAWQNLASLVLLINAGRLRWPGQPGGCNYL